MPNVLIWGKLRELVAGALPPGTSTEEVATLAELQARLDGPGGSLVLADPARLEAEREPLQAWLKAGGKENAVLVAVVEPQEGDTVLRRLPFVDEMLFRPVSPARLRLRLQRARETIDNRRVIKQLEQTIERKREELSELNKIGVALSAERDINKLLELILAKSREITNADAGSLYLVERGKDDEATADDQLRFKLSQNDSVVAPFEEMTMPLTVESIAGYVALTGQELNVANAYEPPPGYPFKIDRSFDEKSGYRTKSMLVVPMRDHENKVIGVVQLINKKNDARTVLRPVSIVDEAVVQFTPVDEELVGSLASQAAVAYENTQLIQRMRDLFDGFIKASVTTIEKRDPVTSGHSGRVALLTVGLAEKVDALATGPFRDVRFSRDQIKEINYASLLHDFGKVGVKENVLLKEKKLFRTELLLIRQRFAYIRRTLEAEHLRAKLEQVLAGRASPELLREMDIAQAAQQKEIEQLVAMIVEANEPSVLPVEGVRSLVDLPRRTYPDWDGNALPFLTENEVVALSIRQGSLTEEQREEIKEHVQFTYDFLERLPWTTDLRQVPKIAWAHHEKLDGSGYPNKLTAADIPIQPRMMTISDIYDALVAQDRPYKRAQPVAKALEILEDEARKGWIDKELLAVFIEAKIYERTARPAGAVAEIPR